MKLGKKIGPNQSSVRILAHPPKDELAPMVVIAEERQRSAGKTLPPSHASYLTYVWQLEGAGQILLHLLQMAALAAGELLQVYTS